jgi:glyoxylase-like metal-dependent hydrolase (beta-lactamase superfamily II)
VLIDPGAEPDTLEKMLAGTDPVGILITHSHMDHTGALDEMMRRLEVAAMGHFDLGLGPGSWRRLKHGDMVEVGEYLLKIIHTPGHTDDQICIKPENDHRIIVGDTIFEGGPGNTQSPEDFRTTLKTLSRIVLPWPDDTVCYPGHGPSFRLGDRRREIEAFLKKDHGDFFGDATWDM